MFSHLQEALGGQDFLHESIFAPKLLAAEIPRGQGGQRPWRWARTRGGFLWAFLGKLLGKNAGKMLGKKNWEKNWQGGKADGKIMKRDGNMLGK